jgi:GTPase SAR1 family protein
MKHQKSPSETSREHQQSIKEQAQVGVAINGDIHGDIHNTQHHHYYQTSSSLYPTDQQSRQSLLKDMRLRFEERLTQAAKLIKLNLAERQDVINQPGKIQRPYELVRRQKDQADQTIPVQTKLIELYDQFNGQLLILGAPGAGKSFLLHQLAMELVERAEQNQNEPVPVIFSLATWQPQQSLKEWMISDLSQRYGLRANHISHLFSLGIILPLLDGLDEVAVFDLRQRCVTAINDYRQEGTPVSIVVTCREKDYQDLTTLTLNIALVVQPLTLNQINKYLAGNKFVSLRRAIKNDTTLAELASSPLFLDILAKIYQDNTHTLPTYINSKQLRQAILTDYVIYCSQEPINKRVYKVPIEQLRAFLAWLARGMIIHKNQQEFYLEFLQATWLKSFRPHLIWGDICFFIPKIFAILLIFPLNKLIPSIAIFLILLSLIIIRIIHYNQIKTSSEKIRLVEFIEWSWSGLISDIMTIPLSIRNPNIPIYIYLFFIILIGLIEWFSLHKFDIVFKSLFIFILFETLLWCVFSFFGVLIKRFKVSIGTSRNIPNEGILRSFRSAIIVGLFFILVNSSVIVLINLIDQLLIAGLLFALTIGFMPYGGRAILQHYLLRLFLAFTTPAPLNLVPWLEEACRRGFLVRVGGGYRFYHELLQQHFASYQEPGFPRVPILAEDHPELLEENS